MSHGASDSVFSVVTRLRFARRDQLGWVLLVVTVRTSVLRHVPDDLVGVFACLEFPDSVTPVLLRLAVAVTLGHIPWRWACRRRRVLTLFDRAAGPKIRGMINLVGRCVRRKGDLEIVLILLVGEPWHAKHARGVRRSRIPSEALRKCPE